jgi:ribonuclease Z
LEFLTLGIGSASPHLERHPSASVLSIDNILILIDCGEGTQYRLLEHKVKVKRIKYIVISHLHGDHYYGLVALISSMSMGKRTEPLHVYGPVGLKEIISIQLKYADSKINFPLFIHVLESNSAFTFIDDEKFTVSNFPLKHRVDCSGFIFREKENKRKILIEKLPANFPVEYIKLLANGQDVNDINSGKTYKNIDFTEAGGSPKSLAYCSDTIFDLEIVSHVTGVDFLYHEATFTEELKNRALVTFHSTAADAATIAKNAKVKTLMIGHFSARYNSLDEFLVESKAIFPNTHLAEQGKTFII